jgi:hypothetical protein
MRRAELEHVAALREAGLIRLDVMTERTRLLRDRASITRGSIDNWIRIARVSTDRRVGLPELGL